MTRKLAQRYVLSKREKESIEAWLNDEITVQEAASSFGLSATNFKAMVGSIMQQLVTQAGVDITRALKNY